MSNYKKISNYKTYSVRTFGCGEFGDDVFVSNNEFVSEDDDNNYYNDEEEFKKCKDQLREMNMRGMNWRTREIIKDIEEKQKRKEEY